MNKLYTLYTTLLIFMVLFSSCDKNKKEYLPLGKVNMYPFEELTTEGRNLRFVFYTEKEYPCINHLIRYHNNSTAGGFDVSLVDVETQTLCLDETGPAKAVVDFGNLASGNYPLKINVADSLNEGNVAISAEKYVICIGNPKLLEIKFDTLFRIPDETIWGVVAFSDTTGFPVKDMFLDSLESRGAVPDSLPEGNFGYFKTGDNGKIELTETGGWTYLETFVYQYPEEWTEIGNIVRYFAFTYPGDIFVYIYNDKGEAYLTNYFY